MCPLVRVDGPSRLDWLRTLSEHDAAPEAAAAAAADLVKNELRTELGLLNVAELRKRARSVGVSEGAVEGAFVAADPKAALVALVVARQMELGVVDDSVEKPRLLERRHASGLVALSLCTTAHPLYTVIANTFGASISQTTTRPNPRRARLCDELWPLEASTRRLGGGRGAADSEPAATKHRRLARLSSGTRGPHFHSALSFVASIWILHVSENGLGRNTGAVPS